MRILRKGFRSILKDIIITQHAEIQAFADGVDIEDVKEDIINSKRFVYFKSQTVLKIGKKNMVVILLTINICITDMFWF